MQLYFVYVCLSILTFMVPLCSCQNLFAPQVITQQEPVWSRSISNSGLIDGRFPNFMHKGNVLTLGINNGKPIFYFVNAKNGQILWGWDNFFRQGETVFMNYLYIHDNILVVNNGPRNYGINMENGQTVWVTAEDRGGRTGATGIGTRYFFPAYENKIFMGNVLTGEEKEILSFQDTLYNFTPVFTQSPTPIVDTNNDTLLVTGISAGNTSGQAFGYTSLVLYNLTQKRIIYNKVQRSNFLSPATGFIVPDGLPQVYNGKVFLGIGKSLQANDVKSGEVLWRDTTSFAEAFFLANLEIYNNWILGHAADGMLYAIEQNTGKIVWQTKTSATAKNIFIMNGVVYLIGGGDGLLHALDASNGKYIWKFKSPDDNGTGSFFSGTVTGDGKNIYVRSFLNLYCYKAAK